MNAGIKSKDLNKGKKKYLVNMPKKLGLSLGIRCYSIETEEGHSLNFRRRDMPKKLIENHPHLYTLIYGGTYNE